VLAAATADGHVSLWDADGLYMPGGCGGGGSGGGTVHRRERPELVPERIASVAMATGKDATPPPLNVGEAGGHLLALRTKQTQLFAGELRVVVVGAVIDGCCY
jgi:hypothetical protein